MGKNKMFSDLSADLTFQRHGVCMCVCCCGDEELVR